MKLTQKNFDTLINNLNHKMTNVENDIKWMKWLGYYMSGLMTTYAIVLMGLIK